MIEVSIYGDSLIELSKKIKNFYVPMKEGMSKIGLILERRVVENLSGPILKVRSGRLRSSITHLVESSMSDVSLKVGTNVIYMAAHEFGAVILPKSVHFLTIPMPGVQGSAGDYGNTFVAKGMIFQKTGNSIRPLFALKRQVKIPSRKPLRRSWEQVQEQSIRTLIDTLEAFLKPTEKYNAGRR